MTSAATDPKNPTRRLGVARAFLAAARLAAAECHASLLCAELAGDTDGTEFASAQIVEVNALCLMAARAVLEAEGAIRDEVAANAERLATAVAALLESGPRATKRAIAQGVGAPTIDVVQAVDNLLAVGRVSMIPGKGYMLTRPIARVEAAPRVLADAE